MERKREEEKKEKENRHGRRPKYKGDKWKERKKDVRERGKEREMGK